MLLDLLLDLLLPRTCAHCMRDLGRAAGVPGALCPACSALLKPPGGPQCLRCSAPVPTGRPLCRACDGAVHACRFIRAAHRHAGPARSLARALKYKGRRDAGAQAAGELAAAFRRHPELSGQSWRALVPVPLHSGRLAERGYNQAALLAEGLSPLIGRPVLDCLERRRATAPLWTLDRRGRRKAVEEAFSARPGLEKAAGMRLLLIDDVCTTGSTLEACARALRRAGAQEVCALTLTRQARDQAGRRAT